MNAEELAYEVRVAEKALFVAELYNMPSEDRLRKELADLRLAAPSN